MCVRACVSWLPTMRETEERVVVLQHSLLLEHVVDEAEVHHGGPQLERVLHVPRQPLHAHELDRIAPLEALAVRVEDLDARAYVDPLLHAVHELDQLVHIVHLGLIAEFLVVVGWQNSDVIESSLNFRILTD